MSPAEPNALAAGLASGFGSGVARLSEILLRPDASAFGSKEAPMDKGCFQAPRLSPCGICMPLGVFSDQYDHVADESYLEALNLFEQCPALRVPFWRSHG